MKKRFYNSIIEVNSLFVALDKLSLRKEEKEHLILLADENLHQMVLDAILSELSEEDKVTFLSHLAKDDHNAVWDFLNEKVEHIGDKIRKAAHDLRDELHKDIKETDKHSY